MQVKVRGPAWGGGKPPDVTINVMLILAKLGGSLDKKGQGPPGSPTIWRGLRRMEAYREAFETGQRKMGRIKRATPWDELFHQP